MLLRYCPVADERAVEIGRGRKLTILMRGGHAGQVQEPAREPHQPLFGETRHPEGSTSSAFCPADDASLAARKGFLYVLATQDALADVVATLARAYYDSNSFDLLPNLADALNLAHHGCFGSQDTVPLALVVHELTLYAAGTMDGALWLVRGDEVASVDLTRGATFGDAEVRGIGSVGAKCHAVERRLQIGDTLVATTRRALSGVAPSALGRVVHSGASLGAMAGIIARMGRGVADGEAVEPPVLVLRVPGFEPVPDIGPTKRLEPPRPFEQRMRPPIARSPVWVALVLAVLAVGSVLVAKHPVITPKVFTDYVMWLLTPAANSTRAVGLTPSPSAGHEGPSVTLMPTLAPARTALAPAIRLTPYPTTGPSKSAPGFSTPTPEATHSYALPLMAYPEERREVCDRPLTVRWSWLGILAENEYFDVRLWAVGAPETSVAWTTAREYTVRDLSNGWYSWRVVVVRGTRGVLETELSGLPTPVGFHWQCDDQPPRPPAR